MATFPILPSLSRAPDFSSTRKIEDGTVSDQKESGYVTTRPRFTRRRRTFGVTWKNLVAEDVRALDYFELEVAQGGANAFYLPSLVPNGSFELSPEQGGDLVAGWSLIEGDLWEVGFAATAADGLTAIQFKQNGKEIDAGVNSSAFIVSDYAVPVTVGDVYLWSAQVGFTQNFGAGFVPTFALQFIVSYADDTTETITAQLGTANTSGYAPMAGTFTIPAGTAPADTMEVSVVANQQNTSGGIAYQGYPQTCTALIDEIGLALVTPKQPYGRMPGSAPLGRPVRFSKPLDIKDAKPAGGMKRYDATGEVTEL